MEFKEWLEAVGCHVEITQEDDGSGYICIEVITPIGPIGKVWEITVQT